MGPSFLHSLAVVAEDGCIHILKLMSALADRCVCSAVSIRSLKLSRAVVSCS